MANGASPTKLERWLFEVLNDLGMAYKKYEPIGAYVADVYLPTVKTLIEVDGSFWHNKHPERDLLRDRILAKRGFTTIRFSDSKFTSEKRAKSIMEKGIKQFLQCLQAKSDIPSHSQYKVFWSTDRYHNIQNVMHL